MYSCESLSAQLVVAFGFPACLLSRRSRACQSVVLSVPFQFLSLWICTSVRQSNPIPPYRPLLADVIIFHVVERKCSDVCGAPSIDTLHSLIEREGRARRPQDLNFLGRTDGRASQGTRKMEGSDGQEVQGRSASLDTIPEETTLDMLDHDDDASSLMDEYVDLSGGSPERDGPRPSSLPSSSCEQVEMSDDSRVPAEVKDDHDHHSTSEGQSDVDMAPQDVPEGTSVQASSTPPASSNATISTPTTTFNSEGAAEPQLQQHQQQDDSHDTSERTKMAHDDQPLSARNAGDEQSQSPDPTVGSADYWSRVPGSPIAPFDTNELEARYTADREEQDIKLQGWGLRSLSFAYGTSKRDLLLTWCDTLCPSLHRQPFKLNSMNSTPKSETG